MSNFNIRRFLLIAAILTVVNYGIEFFTVASFLSFIFRGDIILTVIIGLPAIIGILLQPWFLVFLLFIPGGFGYLLSPLITTFITVLVYGYIIPKSWLERGKRVLLWFKSIKGIAVIFTCLCIGIIICYARYIDFPSLNSSVPGIIKHRLEKYKIKLEESRLYIIVQFIDQECLWRARLSPEEVELIKKEFSLVEIDLTKELSSHFFDRPPYWWNPAKGTNIRAYTTGDFPAKRGPDGLHMLMTYDIESKLLHVWIKDNF
jgi:hypothetical protein